MALDGVADKEMEIVPLQNVSVAVSEVGSLLQSAGEADVVDTVIVITLTKQDGEIKPVIDVMFAGNPTCMARMMREGDDIVKAIISDALLGINKADSAVEGYPF